MKVIVNHRYTYETNLALEIGDQVVVPVPSYLRDVMGATRTGNVTALESDYDGPCESIIKKVTQ